MFELSPQAKAYIVALIRMRLKLPPEKVSDKEINKLFDEIADFVKRQFGF